eukprot:gene18660-25177_t
MDDDVPGVGDSLASIQLPTIDDPSTSFDAFGQSMEAPTPHMRVDPLRASDAFGQSNALDVPCLDTVDEADADAGANSTFEDLPEPFATADNEPEDDDVEAAAAEANGSMAEQSSDLLGISNAMGSASLGDWNRAGPSSRPGSTASSRRTSLGGFSQHKGGPSPALPSISAIEENCPEGGEDSPAHSADSNDDDDGVGATGQGEVQGEVQGGDMGGVQDEVQGEDKGEDEGEDEGEVDPPALTQEDVDDELAKLVAEREKIMEDKVASAFAMFDNMPMGELFSTFRVMKKQEALSKTLQPRRGMERFSGDGSGRNGSRPNSAGFALPTGGLALPPGGFDLPPARLEFKSSLKTSNSGRALIPTRSSRSSANGGAQDAGASTFATPAARPGSSHRRGAQPLQTHTESDTQPPFTSAASGADTDSAAGGESSTTPLTSPSANNQCSLCAPLGSDHKCDCEPQPEQKLYNGPSLLELSREICSPKPLTPVHHSNSNSDSDPAMPQLHHSNSDRDPAMPPVHHSNSDPAMSSRNSSRASSASRERPESGLKGDEGARVATWEFEEMTEDGGVALNFDTFFELANLEKLEAVLEAQFGMVDEMEEEQAHEDMMANLGLSSEPLPSPELSRAAEVLTIAPPADTSSKPASRRTSFLGMLTPRSRPLSRQASSDKLEGQPASSGRTAAGVLARITSLKREPSASRLPPPLLSADASSPGPQSSRPTTPPLGSGIDMQKPPKPTSRPSSVSGERLPTDLSLLLPGSRPMSPSPMGAGATATKESKPVTPKPPDGADQNRADLMKSKKEDLAKAIREQLQAHMARPKLHLDSIDTSTTSSFLPSPQPGGPSPLASPPPGAKPAADALTPPAKSTSTAQSSTKQSTAALSAKGGSSATPSTRQSSVLPPELAASSTATAAAAAAASVTPVSLPEAAAKQILVASLKASQAKMGSPAAAGADVAAAMAAEKADLDRSINVGFIDGKIKPINIVMLITENLQKPFVADAIVANPPAYGHSHCAEKLNCPLHIIFTMPWSPTKAFPSPFARIKTVISDTNSRAREIMNWLSYFAMEDLAWLGMSGMVKDFRQRVLGIKTWNKEHTSHALHHSKVPFTYIWSPSLVSRPKDWPSYCEVVGFINLEVNKLTKYKPPKELADFLADGAPPVYIGFGSLVVGNPAKLTAQFLEALRVTGLRAIIQKGWGGLGVGVKTVPKNVFMLEGNCAHDWLFEQCGSVIHHGGAGTTATGLFAGKPTFIVYFFGDQPFWGAACHSAGVGPEPVGIDDLNAAKIVDALKELILPRRLKAAKEIMAKKHSEDGISNTVDHLHRTVYGALVRLKAAKEIMAKMHEEDGISNTVDHLHRTIYGALVRLKAAKETMAKMHEEDRISNTVDHLHRTIYGALVRLKAAKETMAKMHEEDGISDTVDHLHRTIYGALVRLKAAKETMAKMHEEDRISNTVDHLHRTIYGALVHMRLKAAKETMAKMHEEDRISDTVDHLHRTIYGALVRLKAAKETMAKMHEEDGISDTVDHLHRTIYGALVRLKAAKEIMAKMHEVDRISNTVDHLHRTIYGALVRLKAAKETMAKMHEEDRISNTVDHLHRTIYGALVRLKAAKETMAKMHEEDGISDTVDHLHRTIYGALVRLKAAKETMAKMHEEDRISNTVDHLHRTIYGALVRLKAGKETMAKRHEEDGISDTVDHLHRTIYGSLVRLKAAKETMAKMHEEDGISDTVDHLHRTIYGALVRLKAAKETMAKMHEEDGISDTVDHLHRIIYGALVRLKAAKEIMAKMHEEDGISNTVDHLHRTIYGALVRLKAGKETMAKMHEDDRISNTVDHLHRTIYGALVRLKAAKETMAKMHEEDGISNTVDHLHRTIYGVLVRLKAAKEIMAKIHEEDGISNTVDHLHRTIYGALVRLKAAKEIMAKMHEEDGISDTVDHLHRTIYYGALVRLKAAKETMAKMHEEDGISNTVDHLHRTIYGALVRLKAAKEIMAKMHEEDGISDTVDHLQPHHLRRLKAAKEIMAKMHEEDGISDTVDHLHRTIYGALVRLKAAKETMAKMHEEDRISNTVDHLHRTIYGALVRLKAAKEIMAKMHEEDGISDTVDHLHRTIYGALVRLKAAKEIMAKMHEEDGISDTVDHLHRTIYGALVRLKAAKEIMAKMHEEDGISDTVDHLHRTIYGALVGGKSHMWMHRAESHARHVVLPATSNMDNEIDADGHLRGYLAITEGGPGEAASRTRSAPIEVQRGLPSKSSLGGRPPVPVAPSGGSLCNKGPQVIDPTQLKRKGGFLSFFGC